MKKNRQENISRTEIINYLIKKHSYQYYLEIGVNNPKKNFNKIKIKHKEGVDPDWRGEPKKGKKNEMKSDDFFADLDKDKKYDIIFIDGLHTYEQAKKDIQFSLKHLSEKGTIIVHDCNPQTEWHQRELSEFNRGEEWNGTTWKAFIYYRCTNSNLSMYTIDTDCGCGVIMPGKQNKYEIENLNTCLTWNYFEKNKTELLNLITVKKFFNRNNFN